MIFIWGISFAPNWHHWSDVIYFRHSKSVSHLSDRFIFKPRGISHVHHQLTRVHVADFCGRGGAEWYKSLKTGWFYMIFTILREALAPKATPRHDNDQCTDVMHSNKTGNKLLRPVLKYPLKLASKGENESFACFKIFFSYIVPWYVFIPSI